jgi:hypothetical protein
MIQADQTDNQADDQTADPEPELDLLLKGCYHRNHGSGKSYDAADVIFIHFFLASAALISPTPATTAANAAARSGGVPLRNWMPTLDTVATMVSMPSAVVFINYGRLASRCARKEGA